MHIQNISVKPTIFISSSFNLLVQPCDVDFSALPTAGSHQMIYQTILNPPLFSSFSSLPQRKVIHHGLNFVGNINGHSMKKRKDVEIGYCAQISPYTTLRWKFHFQDLKPAITSFRYLSSPLLHSYMQSKVGYQGRRIANHLQPQIPARHSKYSPLAIPITSLALVEVNMRPVIVSNYKR